jgi:ADP-ribose pyrophosphatase
MSTPDILFQGKRFRVERVMQSGPDGALHAKEVVRHPGAVTILPILDDGRVCLVENFRASLGRRLLELPAGTREPGEDPQATALRELSEETGYVAGNIRLLSTFYMSPGILDEEMRFYLATSLRPGPMSLDAGEDLQPRLCTIGEAIAMVRDGRIEDAKSIVGLLYYQHFERGRM